MKDEVGKKQHRGNDNNLQRLLELCKNNPNEKIPNNRIALHDAIRSGNIPMIDLVLNRTTDVNAVDEYGSSSLHVAVRSGKKEVVELLLERNANLTAKEEDGTTPLHAAVTNGNLEMVRLLLESKADVSAVDEV
ncbi:hypothetical protein PHMEG_00032695 [Phytophthora megakarya]|uniref:Uncharacterized protein n=1 Tax=Phytophthora megakarya TaxID=4795 RepID=A0A225UUC8_9STRA|nr:hypothetical protein PHMEG_00032695 [Phytophthora megakarya]